jgi:hypothetical protein
LNLHIAGHCHGGVVFLYSEVPNAFDVVPELDVDIGSEVGDKAATFRLFLHSLWLFLYNDIVQTSSRQGIWRVVGVILVYLGV